MDPAKVDTMTGWPVPKCKHDVQSFLGLCNFYQHFIQGFSDITHPLTRLTGAMPWAWEKEQQMAFNQFKEALVQCPILRIPIDNVPFKVKCNSSDYANGAILSQLIDNK